MKIVHVNASWRLIRHNHVAKVNIRLSFSFIRLVSPAFPINLVMGCLKRMHLKYSDMFSVNSK